MQGDEGLREAMAAELRRDYESEYSTDEPVSAWYPQADRLLALPEMRRLLADAAAGREAREAVGRVRDLAEEFDKPAPPGPWPEGTRSLYGGGEVCYRILRALDGGDQ